jgi:hypothetical protein
MRRDSSVIAKASSQKFEVFGGEFDRETKNTITNESYLII